MKDPKHILITGGSSGIGEALAHHYAGDGVRLALSGTNPERLEAVANSCRGKGSHVETSLVSVTDKTGMADWIRRLDEAQKLDLVIANAGVALGAADADGLADLAERTFAVNVDGVFHTIHPALKLMKQRRQGQVAIVSSVAGLVGMAGTPAYSASKNAVRAYGEAMRGAYRKHGVQVNVVCPGFVVSRITERNAFKMPFLMTADRAATIIARGLARNKGRIGFPWPTYAMVRFLGILPEAWMTAVFSRGPSK